jgi:hypothetical protein
LPFAGALFPHQAPFLRPAHHYCGDKVADYGKSKHRHLHFLIFGHLFPPFFGVFAALPQKEGLKNDTVRWGG